MSRSSSADLVQGLEGAEATYRLLVEGIPAITYIDAVDEARTNLYTSPQVGDILGVPPGERTENPDLWAEALHPDDRQTVLDRNRECNLTGRPFRAEYRMFARDGREVWFRDEATLVRDEGGVPLFWRGVMLDITELKQAEEKLTRSLEVLRRTMGQRRTLVSRLEDAQEEERRRISTDIHDDSIQIMSAVDMRLQILRKQSQDAGQSAALDELHEIVSLAIGRLRNLVFELRPPALERSGLGAAVRQYLEGRKPEGMPEYRVEDRLEREPPCDVGAAAFRILREAIQNVRKHARATNLEVEMAERDGGVLAGVKDDGVGFSPSAREEPSAGHLGLSAMRERAELVGGWLRVDSEPGAGTTVEFWLPLDAGSTINLEE